MKKLLLVLNKCVKIIFFTSGIIFIILITLALTDVPFYAIHYLGTSESGEIKNPKYIVLLGGGGMPSEDNLIRTYYCSHVAKKYPNAKVIISIPGDINDTLSSISLIKKELITRGCNEERILLENEGKNTRAEALNIAKIIGDKDLLSEILIVTSPEHMYRAIKTFRSVGMLNVRGFSAFEQPLESEIIFKDDSLGGKKIPILPVKNLGKNITLRYKFWNHLHYEIAFFREVFAIWFYKMKGWITF